MKNFRARIGALFVLAASVGTGVYFWIGDDLRQSPGIGDGITKRVLAKALEDTGMVGEFPTEIDLPMDGSSTRVIVQYAFDAKLQETMESLFRTYRPDYGAFVALDPATGRVLSMVSYVNGDRRIEDNLALRATFPSASVFKVVTAAAAIAENNFTANTMVSFNGRNHTLYKSNILKPRYTRWTRYVTFKEAFALSINTVFGRIGAFDLGADALRHYARRFGFNTEIRADVPVQEGKALIVDDPWALAETASGFTQQNTMSPLHGALIASAVVNRGVMLEPYVVQSVHTPDGAKIYEARPQIASNAVNPETADEIRELMRNTVTHGTSRRSFRGFFRRDMRGIDVGGKTGSLTGTDPKGKYDWFVGYADDGSHGIAIAALTVHEKYWRVKSSHLARRAIETYYKDLLHQARMASTDGPQPGRRPGSRKF